MARTSRDILGPRPTGGVAKYRVFEDLTPPLVVDTDRAYIEAKYLGTFNSGYYWAIKTYSFLAGILLLAGFVALFWFPWWTPILGLFFARALYQGTKVSSADFVREIVIGHPEAVPLLVSAGVIRPDLPANAVPA
jgi:hypothetical protein